MGVDWGVAALSVVACPGKFVDKYDAMQKGCILQACCLLETFVKSLQSRDYYVSRLLYDISPSSDVTYFSCRWKLGLYFPRFF